MSAADFRLAPLFALRPAGAPFEILERLGSPAIAEAGRRLASLEAEVRAAAAAAIALAPGPAIEKRIARGADLSPGHLVAHPGLARWDRANRALREAAAALAADIAREHRRLHAVLVEAATRELPDLAAIQSDAFADLLDRLAAPAPDRHGAEERQDDRALALYLQRICAKNDTISRFGPLAWGTIVPGDGAAIRPVPGVAARRVELERWAVHALLAQLDADPEVRPELAPRLHPHARLEGDRCWRLDEEREIPLAAAERELAARCDGHAPAHRLGDPAALSELAARGVIRWSAEPFAIDVSPLASLRRDVAGWRAGPARARWAARLDAIAALVERFAAEPAAPARRAVLAELRGCFDELGLGRRDPQRTLYGARNPISENCLQAGSFTLGERAVEGLIAAAWPWFELYGDAVAFAAARAFRRLHEVVAAAPRRGGALRYSTLVRVAREHGLAIDRDQWHTAAGAEAFEVMKRELAAHLAPRADAPEWTLTAEDCAFLRRAHAFPRGGDLTYPSIDLQIAAASPADAEAGRLEWLVAELHWAPVLLQHVMYWACPDKPALHGALTEVMGGHAFCVNDAFSEAPVHVCGEAIMAAMARPTYVGTGRPKPGWRVVRPADAEVVVDEERRDVRLRDPATGDDLGSLVRSVRLLTGMHPFFPLEREPHTPRLRVGGVIVQRRSWHVDSAALGADRPAGASPAFVAAVERVRAERGIPRWVYARPAPGVIRSPGFYARDKDLKPMYVDLESVVFLDILERRLRKYGQLVVSEMLPAPDRLPWVQPDGRFTFELRTNLVPRR